MARLPAFALSVILEVMKIEWTRPFALCFPAPQSLAKRRKAVFVGEKGTEFCEDAPCPGTTRRKKSILTWNFGPRRRRPRTAGSSPSPGWREYGPWAQVKARAALDPRTDLHKGFEPTVCVAAFVFGFCSGAKSLADVGRLEADGALKELPGIERFPDESALGEWWRHLAARRRDGPAGVAARFLSLGLAPGGAGGGAPRLNAGGLLR